jgi:hypothetical protein
MPKPGIFWDCLDIYSPANQTGVLFTLEPWSLKYCGCCTMDTATTLFAIDDRSPTSLTHRGIAGPPRYNTTGYKPAAKQGMLWAYTDCLAKKGPILKSLADKSLVGADPVTGRNQQVDLAWEQLCLGVQYELQVSKDNVAQCDNNPQLIVTTPAWNTVTGAVTAASGFHGGVLIEPADITRPATFIQPGLLPEAGATYYWRVRVTQSATGQIAISPWSKTWSFSIKPGFIVNTPYLGVQLLSPNNGCIGCAVKPASFSWSPYKEATKYKFVLAKDAAMTQVVQEATTTTTAYEYTGTLEYSKNYFWRVQAVEINGQPIPSDWSATFSFQTTAAPAPPAPPAPAPTTPLWVWVIIAIGAILVIVTLILIFKTRRV